MVKVANGSFPPKLFFTFAKLLPFRLPSGFFTTAYKKCCPQVLQRFFDWNPKQFFLSVKNSDIKCKFAIFRTESDGNLIAWVLWKVLCNLINAQIIRNRAILKLISSAHARVGYYRWEGGPVAKQISRPLWRNFLLGFSQEKLQSSVNSRLESLFHAGRSGQELWLCLPFSITNNIFRYLIEIFLFSDIVSILQAKLFAWILARKAAIIRQ